MNRALTTETLGRLEVLIADGIRCAEGLKAALESERSALENRDTELLGSAVRRKEDRIRRLTELEASRASALGAAGFSADEMQIAAETCAGSDDLVDRWRQFRSIASDCETMNQTNGAIIRLRRQQVADGLTLLRGGAGELDTYGPNGTTPTDGGRALTEA